MSNIGIGRIHDDYYIRNKQNGISNEGINLDDISVFYTTDKVENKRGSYAQTFNEKSVNMSKDGQKFLDGLISNKALLCEKLGLSDEQYDSLACIALGLASQETGMGEEDGYVGENTGIGGFFRSVGKWWDVVIGGNGSASSGVTQMKINDFMNKDTLTDNEKNLLKELGVETWSVNGNNLYENPDKAAVATVVVLNSIAQNYDDYKSMLDNEHSRLGNELSPMSSDEIMSKGEGIINDIVSLYKNASTSAKSEIRGAFKQWLLAQNGSVKGQRGVDKEFNEELQLQNFNAVLEKNGGNTLTQDDLNYIRYYLTSDTQELSMSQYCAYGWNKGTGATGMQLDRVLADKVGTILANPEDFDYDQFTVNVSSLAKLYAQQSVLNATDDVLDNPFADYKFFGQD
jgi:hypothetical protein